MTTSQPPDFHLNRPGVLIAALPAVLGFVPEKSLVLVTADRGQMGCVMRVDLSDDLLDSLGHIAEVAAAARPDSAIAVVVDEEGAYCRMCNDEHRELADRLTAALADRGIEPVFLPSHQFVGSRTVEEQLEYFYAQYARRVAPLYARQGETR